MAGSDGRDGGGDGADGRAECRVHAGRIPRKAGGGESEPARGHVVRGSDAASAAEHGRATVAGRAGEGLQGFIARRREGHSSEW